MEDEEMDLGPCCACERRGKSVRNIILLEKRSPVPGRGWGCVVCGLPPDGAVYVLCDDCLEKKAEPKFACRGYPAKDGRVPIGELTGEHKCESPLEVEVIHIWCRRQ